MARLPQPGGDQGNWGAILNDFLTQSHSTDGTIKTNAVSADAIANASITEALLTPTVLNKLNNVGTVPDGSITEAKLSTAVQTKLNDPAPVTSVAGKTGVVSLVKADVGLGNVDNTSDANKPVSSATQTALNAKAATSSLATVATSGLYSDLSGTPTSTDQLPEGSNNLYFTLVRGAAAAPVQSVAGKTGVVSLVKADVGLGNVDNTTDANKPISSATQTALNAKADSSNVTSGLAGKANTSHAHAIADTTGLQAALDTRVVWVDVVDANTTRPTDAARVIWIGGSTEPNNMQTGDLWFSEA